MLDNARPGAIVALDAALRSGATRDVTLVRVEDHSGDVFLWSGTGKLEHDGQTWEGYGALGSVQLPSSDTETRAADAVFTLSGIDPRFTALLAQTVKGRRVWVWKAFLDRAYQVRFAELACEAVMDQPVLQAEPGGTMAMRVNALAGFSFLERQSQAVWDPEFQRAFLSGAGEDPDSDTGFDLMPEMKNKQIAWLDE